MAKSRESRFHVHDELTAPERSLAVLRGALARGAKISNFVGVLAGAPAVLRGYARFLAELRDGALPRATQLRIAVAVAAHEGCEYQLAQAQRLARSAGLGLDEIALAREFDSFDEREAVLLRYLKALLEGDGPPPEHLQEEAREAGWSDEQLLEAIAHVGVWRFACLVARAANLPAEAATGMRGDLVEAA
ncbi:carboxymuconolactone decarboxylase family protein [Thermoleophilum album]|uniref:Alkylhydroperoxidase AhpD family core domain-containing protein n=1 Tax=Thermoleophilum album TaxID=29539 RepID=A0A1H6FZW2_THEAL|nr:carboxymuconolactone decarboxylase family protein [Thermoleophilum album]SEH15748.1 alkylhydroperoxidase AhpD family core domain-containing protein [Thermoleophilum album]